MFCQQSIRNSDRCFLFQLVGKVELFVLPELTGLAAGQGVLQVDIGSWQNIQEVTSGISSMPRLLNSEVRVPGSTVLSTETITGALFSWQQAKTIHCPPPKGRPFVAEHPGQESFQPHWLQSRPQIVLFIWTFLSFSTLKALLWKAENCRFAARSKSRGLGASSFSFYRRYGKVVKPVDALTGSDPP